MTRIYISIVSHGNDDDIIKNNNLKKISKLDFVTILIKDNLSSEKLKHYCVNNCFEYYSSDKQLGFGANNNINFKLASTLGMQKNDWFVLCNPDIDISVDMINKLFDNVSNYPSHVFAINLYFDQQFSQMEFSLRRFPSFLSFFNVLKGKPFTLSYDKANLPNGSVVDWAAGSFLVFRADLYDKLNGFDESYFMYFEDVDLCQRASTFYGQHVIYLKDVKAVHRGGYQNRKLLSKHFRWYLTSLFRFLIKSTFRVKK